MWKKDNLPNDMRKYHITSRFLMGALKDRNTNNLTNFIQVCKARDTYCTTMRSSYTQM